ncbi:nose resistant to fluoxetine protein 6-like isoform X2 [Panulirus ornatus]|uniref:nose resistant to fluoxetine protein 6-like isoform X2 n=1 Tax=Panulirus ornatus TaxID=150431 RepID=UPI003A88218A
MMLARDGIWLASALFFVCFNGGGCHEAQSWFQLQGRRLLLRQAVDVWSMYVPSHVEPESKCGLALQHMLDSLKLNETWAIKMVDSWGKSADGILFGNFRYAGMYDECVAAKTPDGSIQGRYCNINIRKVEPDDKTKESKINHMRIKANLPDLHLPPISIGTPLEAATNVMMYSTCIPDACTQEDLQDSVSQELNGTKYEVTNSYCHPDDSVPVFSPGDIAFITVVSFLLLLIVMAGIVDIYIEKTNNKTLAKGNLKFLLPFSVYTNTRKLFHLSTEKSPSTVTCLHGIRVLSMTWVVYGHQQMTTLMYPANLYGALPKINGLLFQVIGNAYFSVDTFFFISGVLLAYNVLKQLKRTERFNLFVFYIHRLIRLIPPIGLTVGLCSTVVHLFMFGPYSHNWNYWQDTCQSTWWRDILFIDNFVNDPISLNIGGDCLVQCWYLAVDTQLYLVAPIIILPLFFYNLAGEVWLYVLTLASVIIPASIIYANDLPPSSFFFNPKNPEFFEKVYITPWCRAGPWLWHVVSGWTVAVATGLLVLFGAWSYNTVHPRAQYDLVTQVVYGGLQRTAWAAAVAWVVYACHHGYGGVVDGFLSHPVWQPMSRLTYDIYLVAFPLQYAIAYCSRSPFYFTHVNKIIETVSTIMITGSVAVLVSLTVEAPIISLEKILLGRPDGGKDVPTPAASDGQVKLSGQDNPAYNPEITEHVAVNATELIRSDKVDIN